MDKGLSSTFYSFGIWFLAGYIFVGTFITAVTGNPFIRAFFALGAFVFMMAFFIVGYNKCKHRVYLWLPLIIVFTYIIVFHKTTLLSHFYASIFGLFYAINKKKSFKVIEFVFFVQFLLVAYEFITQSRIYTNVTTGLLNVVDIDHDYSDLMEVSGFRAKGLFMGVLEAATFCIGCSLLFCKSFRLSLLCLVMSIMINGRLAILISSFIFLYNLYIYAKKKKLSNTSIMSSSVRVQHFFDVFNIESADNAGRILSYLQGWDVYINKYSLFDKFTGGEYELLDIYGRATLSAESELTGTLLDIGLIGLIWVISPIFLCLKKKRKLFPRNYISASLLLLLTFVCLVQYRHVSGNVRGILYWLLMFTIMDGYYDEPSKGRIEYGK